MYWVFSILFHIWIWLFEFPIDDISIKFVSYWVLLEATFSSWILSNGLYGAHNLRTSSLRHKDSCIHHIKTLFLEGSIVWQLCLLFLFFRLKRFISLDLSGLFYFVRYLNWAVWPSMWCNFLDISSVKQFLGPLEATFSSWILSNGLYSAHNLRTSSLRHKDSCIHHIKTLFLEGSIVWQLCLLFLFFRLKRFISLDLSGLFYFVRYLNWAVWPSMWCNFLDISSVKQFLGPLEATFSSWILSNGLYSAHNLRTSSLRHKDSCIHHIKTLFLEGSIVWQLCLLFLFFRLKRFISLDLSGLFYFVRYLNWAVWPSMWCNFLDISSVKQFLGPLEAMFSSWILSSGLHCARELRASNLKHKVCCFHQLQTLFVESNIFRQLDSRFLSFWLASWGGSKLKTFAVNVER